MSGEIGCVVLLSGGMDSCTLLGLAREKFNKVAALSVDYAQRHKKELESAEKVAQYYGVSHKILDISNINELIQGSALTSPEVDVPCGHYADESMKVTVVPARNTILLSIAAGWVISLGYTHVSYAAHRGDFAQYPDCRENYVQAMQQVFEVFHFWPVNLWAPFLNIDKAEICRIGLKLKVPYELTWTCYEGGFFGCGKCGSCVERVDAFLQNSAVDPITYLEKWADVADHVKAVLTKGVE